MDRTHDNGTDDPTARVERALKRCVAWSQERRYRKVVAEVDRQLPGLANHPRLEAALLIWRAQALLALGRAEHALPSASTAWDLDPSPHACHLTANGLEAVGDLDGAEEILQMGWRLFPHAVHLPVQLSVILSDQGRHPEALDILDEVPFDHRIPDDLQVFLIGLRSNLLAAMGRWAEADEILARGMDHHPESDLLSKAHSVLIGARERTRAESALAASWSDGLIELTAGALEVDDAVIRCGAVNEYSELTVLAARRLWRAFLENRKTRPQVPDVWGAALTAAVLELDDGRPSITSLARSVGCSPSSVRTAVRRIRGFLDSLDPEIARRAFAAQTNPRLESPSASRQPRARPADIVPFPLS